MRFPTIPNGLSRRITPASVSVALLLVLAVWTGYNFQHLYPTLRKLAIEKPVAMPSAFDIAYQQLKESGPPVPRDFANGVFRKGDSLEALIQKHPHCMRIDHPPYVTLFYGTGDTREDNVRVVAKHGVLAGATIYVPTEPKSYHAITFGDSFDPILFMTRDSYFESLMVAMERRMVDMRIVMAAVVGVACRAGQTGEEVWGK